MKFSFLAYVLIFVALVTFQDMWRASSIASANSIAQAEAAAASAGTSTPLSTATDYVAASMNQHLHVAFCSSCGFGARFEELKKHVETALPGIEVAGSVYPTPLYRRALSWAAYLTTPAVYFGHEKVFEALGQPMPPIVQKIKGYGNAAAVAGFYATSMVSTRLTNTGAYEVAFDGVPLFSKLQSGRFPSPDEVVEAVRNVLVAAGHA